VSDAEPEDPPWLAFSRRAGQLRDAAAALAFDAACLSAKNEISDVACSVALGVHASTKVLVHALGGPAPHDQPTVGQHLTEDVAETPGA